MRISRNFTSTTLTIGLKIIIVLVPVWALFSLINAHLLLTPKVTYSYLPGEAARVVVPDHPASILQTADPAMRWKFSTDTLPFQAVVPRTVESIRIRGYLQIGSQPIVRLRAHGVANADMITLVHSSQLNNLSWPQITDGRYTVWMRPSRDIVDPVTSTTDESEEKTPPVEKKSWTKPVRQYGSIQEFRTEPPDLATVASLGIDRMALTRIPDTNGGDTPVALTQVFRGGHQLYVYTSGGDLNISFDKVDRNRKKDADVITVRVTHAEDLSLRRPVWITSQKIRDDGNTSSRGPAGQPQPVSITIPKAEIGSYFIEIEATDDVVIKNFRSSSDRLAFSGRVLVADGPAYGEKEFHPLTLLTNGTRLSLTPVHEQGKQDVIIAKKKYALDSVNNEVIAEDLEGITSVAINRPDIRFTSDGLMTFLPAKIFPTSGTQPLDLEGDPELDTFDYVIAEYIVPKTTRVSFDETYAWNELLVQGKRLTFQLEMPGLTSKGTTLGLERLTATFIRGPLPWDKFWRRIGGLF